MYRDNILFYLVCKKSSTLDSEVLLHEYVLGTDKGLDELTPPH